MTTRNCLMVMHAREIEESMRCLRALPIDQAWFTGYTEAQLQEPINRFVEESAYENYIIVSDDILADAATFRIVEDGLERHEVFTGWSNIRPGLDRASARRTPIIGSQMFFQVTHYLPPLHRLLTEARIRTFPTMEQVRALGGEFRTKTICNCFTGMRRALWLRFPFMVAKSVYSSRGFGSDIMLYERLKRAGISVWCDSRAFFYHLDRRDHSIVGKVPRRVELVRALIL